jgi:GNAT superfamily N-acetyltransferase
MLLGSGYFDVPAGKVAAVVTSLEMFSPPHLRPELADAAWTLKRIERAEPEWFRSIYRRVGQNWLWFMRLQMSEDDLAALIQHPLMDHYTLETGEREEGLIELDFRQTGECELSFFGVTARLIGTPAGRWLMNRAIERAWSRPIRRFWVHTCTHDHPAALSFYMRSGFHPYRRQIEIVDDPRLDGTLPPSDTPQIPIIE